MFEISIKKMKSRKTLNPAERSFAITTNPDPTLVWRVFSEMNGDGELLDYYNLSKNF